MDTTTSTRPFGDDYLDWKEWPAGEFGRFDATLANYYAAETGIGDGRGLRVLELGFGNGGLLAWLEATGAEVFGVEANPKLVELARTLLGTQRAFGDLDALTASGFARSFSHIVAMDVIEHVPQESIVPLLRQLAELLSKEGRIVLRFPNGDSPFGRINQHGDPTHVTTLGRAKLEYFAQRVGLEVETLRAPALPSGGSGLRRGLRRWLLKAGRALVERIVGTLYFGGQRVPLDPNYLAVLRRRR